MFCEIHRTFFSSSVDTSNNLTSCCEAIFDGSRPFFTFYGTCFTTKATVLEHYPSSVSSLKFWLYINETNVPVFPIDTRGSDGAERMGAVWAVSRLDHPLGVLSTNLKRMTPGGVTIAGLQNREAGLGMSHSSI